MAQGERYRVLLADDAEELRRVLRVCLEHDGRFSIVGEAGDGEEAVQLAASVQPDVILLDVAMPVVDGLEAIPRLQQVAPDAKIAVLSGFSTGSVGTEAVRRGAHHYLEKGTPFPLLADELARLCT
jgi:DNA-binding NarL/FixJ family response regulator